MKNKDLPHWLPGPHSLQQILRLVNFNHVHRINFYTNTPNPCVSEKKTHRRQNLQHVFPACLYTEIYVHFMYVHFPSNMHFTDELQQTDLAYEHLSPWLSPQDKHGHISTWSQLFYRQGNTLQLLTEDHWPTVKIHMQTTKIDTRWTKHILDKLP